MPSFFVPITQPSINPIIPEKSHAHNIKANELTKRVVNDINGCSQIVLLFEEIDCTLTARMEENKQVSDNKRATKSEDDLFKSIGINTLGNLLQLLDGIDSPTDCIIIGE